MVSKSIAVTFVLVACYAMLLCEGQSPMFPANADERKICLANANGRELQSARKMGRLSCKVTCKYDDGKSETYNSPDGQMCCDLVGGLPTGCCSSGSCPPGFVTCSPGSMFN